MAGAAVTAAAPAGTGGLRGVVKSVLNGAVELLMLPMAGLYLGLARLAPGRSDVTFMGFSQFASLWPGVTGQFFRRAFYRWTLTECPRDCSIGFGTTFATADVRMRGFRDRSARGFPSSRAPTAVQTCSF